MRFKGASFNSQWQGFTSTRLKALAWRLRLPSQVKKIKALGVDFVLIQEVGQGEAASFFSKFSDWEYQRFGLNCVGWNSKKLTFVSTQEIDIPDFKQYERTCLVVNLKDTNGGRVRLGSSHFSVKTDADARNQAAQMQMIVSAVNNEKDDAPLVFGVDTNNRQGTVTGTVLGIAKKYGYGWEGKGIDKIFYNFGVQMIGSDSFDLGSASDHDGRVFTMETTKK